MCSAADRPVFAVLTAAGAGTRLGSDLPKALVPIRGVPMVRLAAQGLLAGGVRGIVVTAPKDHRDEFAHALAGVGCDLSPACVLRIVSGGATRQASVHAGMNALAQVAFDLGTQLGEDSLVLVHDAARALTPPAVIRRVITALEQGSTAVIPALPVVDTLKTIDRESADEHLLGAVSSTMDRSTLVAVQTPQGFTWKVLKEAHERGKNLLHDEALAATDDAGLVEHMGGRVDIVAGSEEALKVTTPWDLRIAHQLYDEQILAAQRLTR